MKKKMAALFLTCAMTVTVLAGCGGGNGSGDTGAETSDSSDKGGKDKISIGFTADYLSDFMSYVTDGVEKAPGGGQYVHVSPL